ncbi:TPM domain-containing protein [Lachnospiraceae bacterium 54-53]
MMRIKGIHLLTGQRAVLLAVLMLVLTVFAGNMRVWAESPETGEGSAGQRVFDEAGLFSGKEAEELEARIRSMKNEMNMDVVIVTADDAAGKTAGGYAEDFYIDGGFGVGKDYSGVLFLIDMDNRELYILPVGKMNRFLTDERWNAILDDAYQAVSNEEYGVCAGSFLSGVSKYYEAGIPGGQYNYDKETGKISVYRSIRWYEAALAVLTGLIAAGVSCGSVVRQYSMKKEWGRAQNSLMAYRADCRFLYSDQADNLVNKTVTHVIIPRNNGGGGRGGGGGFSSGGRSTTHTSSGRTMGGGGRKF